jgi:hypothetical protein
MWKSIATAALVFAVSGSALAQTGGSGTTGGGMSAGPGSPGSGATSLSAPPEQLPGTTERSKVAPGSSGTPGTAAGKPRLPPGPSAAEQTRRAGGTVDLNRNSATGMSTNPANPAITGSGSMERQPVLPLGPGTGARDSKVPDSSVYNPGLQR